MDHRGRTSDSSRFPQWYKVAMVVAWKYHVPERRMFNSLSRIHNGLVGIGPGSRARSLSANFYYTPTEKGGRFLCCSLHSHDWPIYTLP